MTDFSTGSDSSCNGGITVEECQGMIQRSLKSPVVRFLREHLEKAGCGVGDNFFKAVNCETQTAGGYTQGKGIVLCSNQISSEDEVNQVLIHELIHAFDDCRAANLDWSNCAHHACSEIRAGHLSGDCHFKRELLRGFMGIRRHEPDQRDSTDMKSKSRVLIGGLMRIILYLEDGGLCIIS
ncbi:mitochondrial inner membrane protease ATP23 isoform X2 [Arachis duranensis]|uniref:Mitochondrial inner membrane protease ATP23 n=1 Tax=Arachis duranensis TaxID=130453 RepID=A0A6P5M8S4_ARADU|nr:mitochondrial inner membrane protease ATP23 isoform X2 [Arachis duranensis]